MGLREEEGIMEINKDVGNFKSTKVKDLAPGAVFRYASVAFKNAALFIKAGDGLIVRLSDGVVGGGESEREVVEVEAVLHATGDKAK